MTGKSKKSSFSHFVSVLRPSHRFMISLALAGLTFFIPHGQLDPLLWAIIIWIVFAFTFTLSGWIIIFTSALDHIKKMAKTEDGSKAFVFVMVLVASFASLFTVALLLISDKGSSRSVLFIPVVVTGMLVSWTMVHTMFTFHYAHMFYDHDEDPGKENAEGVDFPGDDQPDYLDFSYMSFVIGCTFQVSDMQIRSKKIRRTVLLHGLLSFVLNTFVVALTINLIASLSQ